jgi:hypothetical protein
VLNDHGIALFAGGTHGRVGDDPSACLLCQPECGVHSPLGPDETGTGLEYRGLVITDLVLWVSCADFRGWQQVVLKLIALQAFGKL